MPARHKMPEGGKVPLKRIAARVFGQDFAARPKRGFGPPIKDWVNDNQTEAFEVIERVPWLDNVEAARIIGEFSDPLWAHRVWSLYVLATWAAR